MAESCVNGAPNVPAHLEDEMAYLVFCTFDLRSASREDYQKVYGDLERLGLKKVVVADQGQEVVIPTTSCMGQFNYVSAAAAGDDLRNRVQAAVKARGLSSEIFVAVGGSDWAWRSTTT